MRHRQSGVTFIGLLCILALVGAIGYAGLLLVPVYLNYMKIAKTMQSVATEFKGQAADEHAMRRSLDQHFTIEDISEVSTKDIEITKGDDGVTLHIAYDQKVSYIANVSLDVSFDKTVKVE